MQFQIRSQTKLEDSSTRIELEVANADLMYLGYFLESFDGWCTYTTTKNKLFRIDISPSYVEEVNQLLNFLTHWNLD